MRLNSKGVSVVELMVAVVILTTAVLAGVNSFRYITTAIRNTRTRTIATNLAQERMEVLKNYSYFQLLVTTAPTTDAVYPNLRYDNVNYTPDTITMWGLPALTRRALVEYVEASGTALSTASPTGNDTGMKQLTVYITWDEGTEHKKIEIKNLYANPSAASLDSTITGTVRVNATGNPVLPGAVVQVVGSPQWKGTADASGVYSFAVARGTYSVSCSSTGYFQQVSPSVVASRGQAVVVNFTMNQIASGTVLTDVWISTNLVLSQVVASSGMVGAVEVEYVELYNPTTFAWNLAGSGPGTGFDFYYDEKDDGTDPINIDLTPTDISNVTVPVGGYMLLASTSPVTIRGESRIPHAYYTSDASGCTQAGVPANCDIIKQDTSGGFGMQRGGIWVDRVSWSRTAGSPNTSPAQLTEGDPYLLAGGLAAGEQFIRKTSTEATIDRARGNSYDPDSTDLGWVHRAFNDTDNDIVPRITTAIAIAGKPAYSAYGTLNDGTSAGTRAERLLGTNLSPYARLTVTGVSTGTWTMTISSRSLTASVSTVVVGFGATTRVISSVTAPAWDVPGYNVSFVTYTADGGLIEGQVYGAGSAQNTPLGNILVYSNGQSVRTASNGAFVLRVATGTQSVTANFNLDNSNYVSATESAVVVTGESTQVPTFHLGQGGTIKGFTQTSTLQALPDITVLASGGAASVQAVSDQTGYFYISVSTSSTAYVVAAQLDSAMSASYSSDPFSATVDNPGETVFIGTITVAGGMGAIEGTVKEGSPATSITTGVLILASTGTIADPPNTIYSSSAAAIVPAIFAVSSQADGTYSLPVPAGSYNMSAYYPIVDTNNGTVSYIRKTKSAIAVTAGVATTGKDFTW